MATINDIVTRALRLARVVGAGDAPSADDAAEALSSLNSMLAGWSSMGITYTHTDLTLTDDFPLDAKYQDSVQFMLGGRVAREYGIPYSYGHEASLGFNTIYSGLNTRPALTTPKGLQRMPSQFWGVGNETRN